jgi:hypothetical protein
LAAVDFEIAFADLADHFGFFLYLGIDRHALLDELRTDATESAGFRLFNVSTPELGGWNWATNKHITTPRDSTSHNARR